MKDLKISKELIEEVMKDKGTFETININKNELSTFGVFGHHIFSINIYEFTFKCKEWARNKYNITISSSLYKNYAKSWNIDKDKSYTAKTEVEVIIEACNWILENIK